MDELAKACEGKDREVLIWPAQNGGHLGPPAGNKSWLSGAVDRCQAADERFPRITAHALRHTAASLAISAGANVAGRLRRPFDDDLTGVAQKLDESVGKMWARGANMDG
jgi:integrase